MAEPREITQKEFVRYFQLCTEKKFARLCFVTGAGTSFASKIPTGAALAKKWLEEISDQNWKEDKGINSENAPIYYSAIYEKRFEIDAREGQATLEELMAGKEPSVGYSILVKILADNNNLHNLVITTNFDSLIEDALFIYTDAKPLVLGHESWLCEQAASIATTPDIKKSFLAKEYITQSCFGVKIDF